jgi:hypothetical protein
MIDRCDVHGRFLTIGEVIVQACSWCDPEAFEGVCTKCGYRTDGKACRGHFRLMKGGK